MEAGLPEGKADKPEVGPTPLFSFQQDGDETIKITIKVQVVFICLKKYSVILF